MRDPQLRAREQQAERPAPREAPVAPPHESSGTGLRQAGAGILRGLDRAERLVLSLIDDRQ
jgi:hypothetical protein